MAARESSVEFWEAHYREGDTPWEKGFGAPPLAEYLERSTFQGRVLVPGCGFGHDVRLLARQGARPLGLDVSPNALASARSFQPAGEEEYLLGDLFDLDGSLKGSFAGVFEHTCLCAIDPARRPEYARAVVDALQAGGALLAIFFIDIEDPEGPPHPISSTEIDRLFHPFFETVEQWLPGKSFPGREGREQMRLMRKR